MKLRTRDLGFRRSGFTLGFNLRRLWRQELTDLTFKYRQAAGALPG